MNPHRASSNCSVSWSVLMLTPSGHVQVVEVCSPSESLALDTVRYWKPYHRVATDLRGKPRIRQAPPSDSAADGRSGGQGSRLPGSEE